MTKSSLNKPKTDFQKSFEDLLERNKRIFEEVELNRMSADAGAVVSAKLISKFINDMRYPLESKVVIHSGINTD